MLSGRGDRASVDDSTMVRKTQEWSCGTSSKDDSGVLGVELEQKQRNAGKEANWSRASKQENFVKAKDHEH